MINNRYNPVEIENKWQKLWQDEEIYKVDLEDISESQKSKFYAFGMFNYPSGEGIHVGHVKNFVLPDVLLRWRRQKGDLTYAPVGFDSFGLPAENFALKTGIPPRQTTDTAIANYSQQYKACGFSFDWSKMIDTSQPEYYRWTQWCFLQLYKAGLAYQKESSQWWCEKCLTVLADEQVINGRCWRHDDQNDPFIGRKSLKQWFFKITDYAQEILEATPELNWTSWVKTAQQNYIGRSEGFEIQFALEGWDLKGKILAVFTTALETIYGATFMVIAPEHALLKKILAKAPNRAALEEYIVQAQRKSEIARQQAKDKTGVLIEGLTAIHPITAQPLPIFIADYVLISYGTGSIMAVPGADTRDLEFAKKHNLKILPVVNDHDFLPYKDIVARATQYKLRAPDDLNGLDMMVAKKAIFKKLKSSKKAIPKVNFKLRDWLISRQRYWGAPIPIIFCEACGVVPVPEKNLPVELPEIEDYTPSGDGRSPLDKVKAWVETPCPNCKQMARRETDTMDGYVCSSWYQMRYLSPDHEEKPWDEVLAQKWLPVDFYNGADHATAHLIYARFFTRFFHKKGLVPTPEPFQKMYLHAKILAPDGQFFSKSKGNGINPLDIIEQGYGADALRVYICALAPPDVEAVWDERGINGAWRFLSRTWALVTDYLKNKPLSSQAESHQALMQATHRCIATNNRDLKRLKFNTALAAQMELLNLFYKMAAEDKFQNQAWQFCLESFAMLLAPFAPHLASEIWQVLGHLDHIHINYWPQLDKQYLTLDQQQLAIQVNGRLRGTIEISSSEDEETILKEAQAIASVAKHLKGKKIVKTIYVPGRIVSFATLQPPGK